MYLKKFIARINQQNSFVKYLKYGIGEIVLLVIGILLALQINNWNENRKAKHELNRILEFIHADLDSDLKQIDRFIESYEVKKEIFDTLLRNTPNDYMKGPRSIGLHTNYGYVVVNQRGYKLLANSTQSALTRPDTSVQRILNFYSAYIQNNENLKELLKNHTQQVLEDFQKYPWYGDYLNGKITQKMIDEIWADTKSKNNIYQYDLIASRNYLPTLKAFRDECIMIQEQIHEILTNEN